MALSFSISCLTNSISFLSTSISFYLSCVQLYLFIFPSKLKYPLISFNLQLSILSYLSCIQFYFFLFLHTSLKISISSDRFLSLVHMALSFSISCLTNSISFSSTFYLSCVKLYLFLFPNQLNYPLISFNLQFSIPSYLSCIQFYLFLYLHMSLKIFIFSDRFPSLVHMSQYFSISCLTNSISFLSTSISFHLFFIHLYLLLSLVCPIKLPTYLF